MARLFESDISFRQKSKNIIRYSKLVDQRVSCTKLKILFKVVHVGDNKEDNFGLDIQKALAEKNKLDFFLSWKKLLESVLRINS